MNKLNIHVHSIIRIYRDVSSIGSDIVVNVIAQPLNDAKVDTEIDKTEDQSMNKQVRCLLKIISDDI